MDFGCFFFKYHLKALMFLQPIFIVISNLILLTLFFKSGFIQKLEQMWLVKTALLHIFSCPELVTLV